MSVFRYNEAVQKLLNSKTKPEPWLHIVFADTNKRKTSDKRDLLYAIYVWDTRDVVEEGLYKGFTGDLGPGRGDGKFDAFKHARDNAKPLRGAKHEYVFDSDDIPLVPLKISKVGLIGNLRYVVAFSAGNGENAGVIVKVGATINGHGVLFKTESKRFGFLEHGAQVEQDAMVLVDGKPHALFVKGRGISGYYGSAISFKPTFVPVGKSQYFVGQKYVCKNYAKEFIDAFVKVAAERPEIFSPAFKKAIGCAY